jgi:glycosyltransferase involved in cell wall biosynthesis
VSTGICDLVCLSHLRWSGVYQRPQQLLSRFAHSRRILFIEEPENEDTETPYIAEVACEAANITVIRPKMPCRYPYFVGDQLIALRSLISQFVLQWAQNDYDIWLYSPMALPIAESLNPIVRVFDCMDELSAFKYAPPELLDRDRDTMRWADIVFTGGMSIYESRRHLHRNIHCMPSSVDASHFRQVLNTDISEPEDQRHLSPPLLGYFGVIDERMDLNVLDALGRTHPEWNIVMIGPVVKIETEQLPKLDNIHFMGQRSYELLPRYLKGWQVALIPFAMNEATRFISPTKVLEYMAAELPIVSAPITDLLQFRTVVQFASSPAAFIAQCESVLAAPEAAKQEWARDMRCIVNRTSWDETVNRMLSIVTSAAQCRTTRF